jgi:hypothetical protein
MPNAFSGLKAMNSNFVNKDTARPPRRRGLFDRLLAWLSKGARHLPACQG